MLKRLYWLGLGIVAGWLAWEWLRQGQAATGAHEPQFATSPTYPRADDDQVLPSAAAAPAAAADTPADAEQAAPPAALPPTAYPRADDDQVSLPDAPAADPAQAIVGYCTRCREKRPIQNAAETTSANGRRAARGTCPVCGAKMFTFLENR